MSSAKPASSSATTSSSSKPSAPAAGTATVGTTDHRAGLEEDDEFEEFEDADWQVQPVPEQQDWKDDWDDEMNDADFITQLRQELAKTNVVGQQVTSSTGAVIQPKDKQARRS